MLHLDKKREIPPLKGYLLKEGGIYKSWKRRWFVVEGDILKYYVNESKELCKGTITISTIQSVKPIQSNSLSSSSSSSTLGSNSGGSSRDNSRGDGSNKRSLSSSIHNIPIDVNSSNHNVQLTSSYNSITDSHHHSGQETWIFSIITQPRTYTLRASTESEMYYWIQGLRNIQLDSNIISFTNAQKERSINKSGTLNRQSVDQSEMYKQELTRLSYQCSEMKQHYSQIKNELQVSISDHASLVNVIQEQFKQFKLESHKTHILQQQQVDRLQNQLQIKLQSTPSLSTISNNSNRVDAIELTPKRVMDQPIAPNGMALWYPDESSVSCFTCKSMFTFFKRRHHCRHCGGLFCASCTNQQAIAQGYIQKTRVCIQCAQSIWTKHDKPSNFLSYSS